MTRPSARTLDIALVVLVLAFLGIIVLVGVLPDPRGW
jgi:hypothetical protein